MSWPVYKLGEIAEVIRGVTFSKADGSDFPEKGRIPVIRAGSIQKSLLIDEGQIWVSDKKVKNHQLIKQHDIIMCTSSGSADLVGKCAISEGDYNVSFGAFCAGIRSNVERVSPLYLYHFLCSPSFKNWTKNSSGANIKNIRISELADFEIPLPPLAEQKRIASILDKADAIRRKRQQAIDLADEFLRAVFLDMFGSMVNKENWKSVNFGDVTLIDAAMVDPREDEYLDMLHIGPDRIEKNTGKLLPALSAREEGLISKKFLFNDSYVLYSKIRPYLRKVALPEFEGLCSADMYPIRPIEGMMTREYLWQLLLSDEFTQYTETLPGRANIPKLNRNELAAFSFKLPPIELQKRFTTIFCQYNKNLTASRFGNEKTSELFNSLSQKAFSGDL